MVGAITAAVALVANQALGASSSSRKKKKASKTTPLPGYQEYIEPGQTLTYTYEEFLARVRTFLLVNPILVKDVLGGQLRVSMTSSWTEPFTSIIEPMGSTWSYFHILPSGLARRGVDEAALIEVVMEYAGDNDDKILATLRDLKVDPWHMENGKEMEYNVVIESGGVSYAYQIKIVP